VHFNECVMSVRSHHKYICLMRIYLKIIKQFRNLPMPMSTANIEFEPAGTTQLDAGRTHIASFLRVHTLMLKALKNFSTREKTSDVKINMCMCAHWEPKRQQVAVMCVTFVSHRKKVANRSAEKNVPASAFLILKLNSL